ncbi:MAG: hypothetical protein RL515_653 [Verrucomicrobiota bacterium]
MSSVEARLAELGVTLPTPPAAAGAYVPAVRTGNLLYLAGTLPMKDGKVASLGKVGREVDLIQAPTPRPPSARSTASPAS